MLKSLYLPTGLFLRLLTCLSVMFHGIVPIHAHLANQRTLSKVICKNRWMSIFINNVFLLIWCGSSQAY